MRAAVLFGMFLVVACGSDPAGTPDAGFPDAAPSDATVRDGEFRDGDLPDAELNDAALLDQGVDVGPIDGGEADAGEVDASEVDAEVIDTGSTDAQAIDSGVADSGVIDTGPLDAEPIDADEIDGEVIDTGPTDLGSPDTGPTDLGAPDLGPSDSGIVDAGPVDLGLAQEGDCYPSGWCWYNPHPVGGAYTALHGSSTTNVWRVGPNGLATQWDGVEWTNRSSPAGNSLNAVFVVDPSEVWAVGDFRAVLRWNGVAWEDHEVDIGGALNIEDVWVAPTGEVWVVESFGGIYRFAAGAWSEIRARGIASDALEAVFGFTDDDVWFSGNAGQIWHWNGAILSDHGLATTGDLNDIWGPDPANVFIGGQSGLLGHWNGTQFVAVPGTPAITIEEIHGTSATDFWVGGFSLAHFTGTWSPAESPPSGNNIEGLWATGGGELFIQTGESPWIRTATSDIDIGGPLPGEHVIDVDGSSTSNVWFIADTSLYQFDGLHFTQHPVDVSDVWVLDEDNAWAAAGNTILHWDGDLWTPEVMPPLPGTSAVRHIHVISASDILAVGSNGLALHFNGTGWSLVTTGTTQHLGEVWGLVPSGGGRDYWVLAGGGTLLYRWDGTTWRSIDLGQSSTYPLTEIYGTSATMYIAAEDRASARGRIFEIDLVAGSTVSVNATDRWYPNDLRGAQGDVWTVNSEGVIRRSQAGSGYAIWEDVPIPLRGIYGATNSDIWAVGEDGTILRYR